MLGERVDGGSGLMGGDWDEWKAWRDAAAAAILLLLLLIFLINKIEQNKYESVISQVIYDLNCMSRLGGSILRHPCLQNIDRRIC